MNFGRMKGFKREIIEWGALIVVLGGLYLSGWHTEVLGTLQRGILATGLFDADADEEETKKADLNWMLLDANGQRIHLEDYRGKTLFINLWATWCAPCVAEMPDIHELYQKTNDQVVFFMISVDADKEKMRSFIKRKDYQFPIYTQASARPESFATKSIPTTFVVSPEGKIVFMRKGMSSYDNADFIEFLTGH